MYRSHPAQGQISRAKYIFHDFGRDLRDTNDIPTLFNIFLERITTDALEDHEDTVSIGGRTISNLRFADDVDGLAGEEEELANLVQRLYKASTA